MYVRKVFANNCLFNRNAFRSGHLRRLPQVLSPGYPRCGEPAKRRRRRWFRARARDPKQQLAGAFDVEPIDLTEAHGIAGVELDAVGDVSLGHKQQTKPSLGKRPSRRSAFKAQDEERLGLPDRDRRLHAAHPGGDGKPVASPLVYRKGLLAISWLLSRVRGEHQHLHEMQFIHGRMVRSKCRTPVPALMYCTPPGPTTPRFPMLS